VTPHGVARGAPIAPANEVYVLPNAPVRVTVRRRLGLLLAGALAVTMILGTSPAPVDAATATPASLSAEMIRQINKQRTSRGLVVYRTDARLNALAQERAGNMASKGVLSHAAAGGSVGAALDARRIQWYAYGEVIGWSGYPWSNQAVSHLVSMWMGSSGHRPLILSSRYNYVGAGLAYRSADGTTWASVVFTESRDHTAPLASVTGSSVSGTTIRFAWSGKDRRLQTHTAGLRSFDVQYRVDGGAWRTIRDNTDATSITLRYRARGHSYSIRVQSADRRGNLSAWTSAKTVWVP
jgi:uncharacterized protein YkwD